MIELDKYTSTELLKMSNDVKLEHDKIRLSIVDDINIVDVIQKKINEKLEKLDDLKNLNTLIIDELNKR